VESEKIQTSLSCAKNKGRESRRSFLFREYATVKKRRRDIDDCGSQSTKKGRRKRIQTLIVSREKRKKRARETE